MRRRRALVTVAVSTAIVLLVASCGGENGSDGTSGGGTPTAELTAQEPTDLQAILLPEEEHPEGTTVFQTSTLKQASALVLPGTGEPSGVVVMPRCMSYFAAIGGLDAHDGWHQFGMRGDGTTFVNLVADVDDADDAMELLRLRISACNEGLMRIEGWPPSALNDEAARGTMSFEENDAPSIPGANVFAFRQSVTFHDPEDPVTQAVREAWGCPDTACVSQTLFVGIDNTLIYVLESEERATEIAEAIAERASG